MRLGKIKCAAKALAFVSACSSFNFCEALAFCRPFLPLSFMVCTVVIALLVTLDGFVQVGDFTFRLPITEVQFIGKCSLFILLLGVIRHAGTAADACT